VEARDATRRAPQPQQEPPQQPRTLTAVLDQLSANAYHISDAEAALRQLLARQAALHHIGRKLEQQQVLGALQAHRLQLGFSRGRPVSAVLLYRCMQHWGVLRQQQPCPLLEQLAGLLQQQLEVGSDGDGDASAPAAVAGLQCNVADRSVCVCVHNQCGTLLSQRAHADTAKHTLRTPCLPSLWHPHSLALCAVLYCLLAKAAAPELAAAAAARAAGGRGGGARHASAAEVVAAASRKVAATLSAQMAPGLQVRGLRVRNARVPACTAVRVGFLA
jgi:hypothetical protein